MDQAPGWVVGLLRRAMGDARADEVVADLDELRMVRGTGRWRTMDTVDALRLAGRWAWEEKMSGVGRDRGQSGFFAHDLRLAFRTVRRSPGATVAILGTLALSVGVTSALFSVVDAVVLRGLPYEDPDRLVVLWETEPADGRRNPLAPPTLEDYRAGMETVTDLGGWALERYTLTGLGAAEQILAVRATPELFPLLGVSPTRGRAFRPDEADHNTAVLSHGFWQSRFGGDPGVLQRTVILDDVTYEVIGVMSPGFRFPDAEDIAMWIPLTRYPWEEQRWTRTTTVLGRLAENASLEAAQAEASSIAAGLAETHPRTNQGWGAEVTPARVLMGDHSNLAILASTVLLVLLIAVTNVANLLGVRASERTRELSVRSALGASRASLVRLLLAESLVYGGLGVLGGLLVAAVALRALLTLEPGTIPRWNPVTLDLRAVAFTALVGVGVAVLAGVVPAFRAGRGNFRQVSAGRAATGGRRTMRGRALLSSFEVALAIVLTTGASLLVTSFLRLRAVDPGFEPNGLLAATVELPDTRYVAGEGRVAQAFDDIRERVLALPGVVNAGWVTALPMSPVGTDYDVDFFRNARLDLTPADTPPRADFRVVSEGYMEALELPLLAGRFLEDDIETGSPATVVINRAMADRYFPGENPVGQSVSLYETDREAYEIVGVVGDVRHRGLDDPGRPEIYLEFHHMVHSAMTLLVRTAGEPLDQAEAVVAAVHAVDPDLPVHELRPMTELVGDTMAERRFHASLLLAFAGLGLALALIGVHGTLAYSVSRRTREIGVRMAVGADRARVVVEVLQSGVRVVAIGLVVGIVGTLAGARLLRSFLYGIEPNDPLLLIAVSLAVGLTAVAATLVPALRASRVDPVTALSSD